MKSVILFPSEFTIREENGQQVVHYTAEANAKLDEAGWPMSNHIKVSILKRQDGCLVLTPRFTDN